MKYCTQCGNQLVDEAVVCPQCGCAAALKNMTLDVPSKGLNVLGFLFPLVGLILYLVNREKAPIKANAIGTWALIGFVAGLVLNLMV